MSQVGADLVDQRSLEGDGVPQADVKLANKEVARSDRIISNGERKQDGHTIETPISVTQGKRGTLTSLGRELAGITAALTDNKTARQLFGVHSPQRYIEGMVGNRHDPDLERNVKAAIARVREKVLGKIELAVDAIGEDKLTDKEAKELSIIAANLSRVVQSTRKEEDNSVRGGVIFISAADKNESDYDTKEV